MSAYFVTATGTDIGKTFVTAGLVRALRERGKAVDVLKPVVSGFSTAGLAASDPGVLLDALGETPSASAVAAISPWRFAAPLSPDMAAAREGRAVEFDELVRFCARAIADARGALFIEGVGGIMVPLDARHTVLDWMKALDLPLLVVTGSYLGAINHTLTTLDVLARAGLSVRVLVLNESADATVPLFETRETLGRFVRGVPIATIPRVEAPADAKDAFAGIVDLL